MLRVGLRKSKSSTNFIGSERNYAKKFDSAKILFFYSTSQMLYFSTDFVGPRIIVTFRQFGKKFNIWSC